MYLEILVEYTKCVPVQKATTVSVYADRLIHVNIVQRCWQIQMMTSRGSLYIMIAITEMDVA